MGGGALTVLLTMGVAKGENYSHQWTHPCDTPPDYGLVCGAGGGGGEGPSSNDCWCQADWSDADNWVTGWGSGYPDDTDDNPYIPHSNTGHCDGGTNDGDPCSESGDCPSGTCENVETDLLIRLTENIVTSTLTIETTNSAATSDHQRLRIFSRTCSGGTWAGMACDSNSDCLGGSCGSGTYELSVPVLILDATYGPISLSVGARTTLVTE